MASNSGRYNDMNLTRVTSPCCFWRGCRTSYGKLFPLISPSWKSRDTNTSDRPHKRFGVCYARGKRIAKGHPSKPFMRASFALRNPDWTHIECFQTCLDYDANVGETFLNCTLGILWSSSNCCIIILCWSLVLYCGL